MIHLRHGSARASKHALASSAALRPSCVSPAIYRQLPGNDISAQRYASVYASQKPSAASIPPLCSNFLPQDLRLSFSGLGRSRSFHSSPLAQQESSAASAKPENKEGPQADPKASSEEQGHKEDSGGQDGEKGEGEKKQKKKKEDAPPPPPHGNKSPWEVFRETLQSEFKASKEWNESTKALASSANQFTESESVRRARQAYEASTSAVTSTAGNVLKTTAGAVGKGAAWTWETPVMKGVRTAANATGAVLEKTTRPVRESESFKNIKNVIDDGSSSRYGGWVEKEERRKARELREAKEAAAAGRPGAKRAEVLQEDPK